MPLVGLNHCQPILHTSKIMVHCYTTDETMNQFEIGYRINPSLKFNNVFIIQVEKCLSVSFSARTMKTVKDCLMKNNACVMVLIFFMKIMEKYQNNSIEC